MDRVGALANAIFEGLDLSGAPLRVRSEAEFRPADSIAGPAESGLQMIPVGESAWQAHLWVQTPSVGQIASLAPTRNLAVDLVLERTGVSYMGIYVDHVIGDVTLAESQMFELEKKKLLR